MPKTLASILRPKSFSGMIGQEKLVSAIRKQVVSGRIPSAWMITGETGSGKTTVARIIARAVNCPHKKPKHFGSYCSKCEDMSASIAEINAARYRGVEDMMPLVSTSDYAPIPPAIRRVIILDEAQRLSKEAQSVLLKPTEDPPETSVWIICTTDPHKISRTLRGRFMIYSMLPLKHKIVEEFIRWAAKQAKIKRDLSDFIDYIHEEGVTSARNILNMLEKYGAGIDPDKAAADSAVSVNPMKIAKSIFAGEWGMCRSELERATPDDIRLIRGAILGFCKERLLNKHPGINRVLLSKTIESMATISYGMDEASQLALFCAKIYKLCSTFMRDARSYK